MSGKGNCYDRAMGAIGSSPMARAAVESFFKTIKAEPIWRRSWETRRQAETAFGIPSNQWQSCPHSNTSTASITRTVSIQHSAFSIQHSALGGKSPSAFERQVA
jgi:putative transposase